MKSGNFKYLEPSGPVQACNGTDLPLAFTVILSVTHPTQKSQGSNLRLKKPMYYSTIRQFFFSPLCDEYGICYEELIIKYKIYTPT